MLARCFFVGIAGLLLGTGCQPAVRQAEQKPAGEPNVPMVRGDGKKLEEMIAKHKGEVVLVDYWATWCLACVENFPHTVEVAKKYRGEGLATIAVSFDLLEDEETARKFLADQGADFEHLISQYNGVSQQAAVDFDVEALPQYRLYDRQGKLREKWEGKSEEMEAKVQALLAEKA